MSTLLLLFGCVVLGALLNAYYSRAETLKSAAQAWVIFIALPAIILKEIPVMTFGADAWLALVGGLWIFIGAGGFFLSLGRVFGWSRATIACLVLTAGLGNTTFVGLPVLRIFIGEHAIGPALVFDQVGSFLPLATGGALAVAWGQGEAVDWSSMLKRLATFPPTVAVATALVVNAEVLAPAVPILSLVSMTLSPVALLAVGLTTSISRITQVRELALGLTWKLALAPLGVWGLATLMNTSELWTHTAVLQAGMPPMVTGGIVAASADLEPELASRMVVVGLFTSVVSLLLWNLVLS